MGLGTLAATLDFSKVLAYDFGSKFEMSHRFANCRCEARYVFCSDVLEEAGWDQRIYNMTWL